VLRVSAGAASLARNASIAAVAALVLMGRSLSSLTRFRA
jgi:hypothetical protein